MKKLLCLLLSLLLALSLCACGKTQPPADDGGEAVTVRLGALKGPTAMGMAKIFSDRRQERKGAPAQGRAR